MNINEQLNQYQTEWLNNIFEPFVSDNPDLHISIPFFTGVSPEYEAATKKIMIVGQETAGWGEYDNNCIIKDTRQWSIDYLRYQLGYDGRTELIAEEAKNRSQFWNFFRAFSRDNFVPCWNNIDKAQRTINGKTVSLTEKIECALNRNVVDNKTLFQMEVEIIKPDAIVFITGSNYSFTMEKALNLNKYSLNDFKMSIQNSCVDISSVANLGLPTFWTYHPSYISRNRELRRNDIISKIKESF